MDFSWIFEEIICLFILLVEDCLLGEISERLQLLRFPNWRGIFKNSIPSDLCENSPKGGPRKCRSRQKKCKRGRKGQLTWQDLIMLSILQEDTPQEDGAVHITDRSTGGSTQPPTDVNNDCSSSDIGPFKNNGSAKEITQAELSQMKLLTESVITGQDGLAAIEVSVAQEEGKISRYPYQLDTSKTGEKPPKDGTANKEPSAPSLQDNKDENLNKLPEEQSDKKPGSTSEQSLEVISSDIKTQEESDGDNTSESTTTKTEEEIPPDVLRISLVETIYESKAVVSGKPTKAGQKVPSPKPFQGRRPFRPRASTRTPTAASVGQIRSPAEWQVTVIHKKTLGHKRKNFQRFGPPTDTTSSADALLPSENVLKSCKSHITTVIEEQLMEQITSSPETATNKTRVEDVSLKDGKDVVHATSPTCDETTLKNAVPAGSSPSSDVPGSLEPDADPLERRRLAKIGRKQRARMRKRIAQEAAQTAIKLRQRLITTDDGEIVISRDQEDWAEVVGLPFSITHFVMYIFPQKEIHPARVSIPEWVKRYLPKVGISL
ncbi:hypothetical protein HOLleu_34364 [Holothuria leucospilota]|uniref:Uncharacterized protein n=1 Tax=Holothuria leucospilota TaxID=206669 RepID=A0A9Q0YS23_HOLLE|nr:hypothetical protein HOLleu_34364 [Holothuria leucospilota]